MAIQDREADKSMTASSLKVGARVRLAAGDFQHLLDVLAGRGYQVMGPTLEDGQLIYGEIGQVTDFPIGWTAFQAGGTFRLEPRQDQALFGFAVGQQSWKQFLLPPHQTLWQAHREGSGWRVIPQAAAVPQIRLRRGPVLRTPGHGRAGPGLSQGRPCRSHLPSPAGAGLHRGGELRPPGPGHVFLRLHGDRAPGHRGV